MRIVFLVLFAILVVSDAFSQRYSVSSPDKNIALKIFLDKEVRFSVTWKDSIIILPSPLSLTIDGKVLGHQPKVLRAIPVPINDTIEATIARKSKYIPHVYSELRIDFKGDFSLIFRVFNNGIAYRFVTRSGKKVRVEQEQLDVNLPEHTHVFFPEEESFMSDNERPYLYKKLTGLTAGKFCSLPMLAKVYDSVNILITDADLLDYPNLFLSATGTHTLKAVFPPVVLTAIPAERNGDRMETITQEASYMAETTGTRSFPWRVFTITGSDARLAESDLVYQLSSPSVVPDTRWIKPGKVAWDWWNANNIYGVDFRAGINTATYKYYIDFAARYGLEYILLDEGWSASTTDLNKAVPAVDLPDLIHYGQSKNVGIILWSLWKPLDKDMNGLLDLYASWGVKGIKVDFMQRSDQWMVNFYERLARACAERHLLVDFHGSFKPAGLHRKYPNVMSHEGVKGMEQSKWTHSITPSHNVTLPFIRMVAGPMDYTPGAMNNATQHSFRDIFENPMSMGTRCHQVAMYIVYESPLMMLADSPTKYLKENESTEFIASIPVTWDETHVQTAKIGEYIMTVRRKGADWFVGAMTDWNSRELLLDCSFLPSGTYDASIMQDGINADRNANDYKQVQIEVVPGTSLKIRMAPGGGWAAVFRKRGGGWK